MTTSNKVMVASAFAVAATINPVIATAGLAYIAANETLGPKAKAGREPTPIFPASHQTIPVRTDEEAQQIFEREQAQMIESSLETIKERLANVAKKVGRPRSSAKAVANPLHLERYELLKDTEA